MVKNIIKKILLGKISKVEGPQINPFQKSISNIKSIWHNQHQDDHGIEKIIRLFLSSSQLVFPGLYLKTIASKKGPEYKALATDFYILFKIIFPLFILINGWYYNLFFIGIMLYLLLETILYIPTLIFASDLLSRPRSYRRSMLLLFFNYLEIIFSYAVLYSSGNYLNKPFTHWFDAIYFSVITSTSVGFGDFYPETIFGEVLVSTQSLLFLFFIILFLNFFSTKVKTKGYFDHED